LHQITGMNVDGFLGSAELALGRDDQGLAASLMTTLKIRNLTLFDAGTMS
jgi:hypothetical protein